MKRILVILAIALGLLSLSTPAQAHTSVCDVRVGTPYLYSGVIHFKGEITCPTGWHATKQSTQNNVQVWAKKYFWWGWRDMTPTLTDSAYSRYLKFEGAAGCLKGTHKYRSKIRHTQSGYHGPVTKTYYSPYSTTRTC